MFADDDFNEEYNRVRFEYSSRMGNVSNHVTKSLESEEAYTEIVQEFVYFLQSMGFTYIEGLAVLGENGKELHVTDM